MKRCRENGRYLTSFLFGAILRLVSSWYGFGSRERAFFLESFAKDTKFLIYNTHEYGAKEENA